MKKIYIICCVLAQIPYLGKRLFQRCGSKYSQPVRLQDFLINPISRTNQWNNLIFLYVDTNSHKLKEVDQNILGWVWSEMSGRSGHWTLKLCLKNELMEWTDFLHTGGNSWKLKVILMIFEWVWSKTDLAIFSTWHSKICVMSLWIELSFCMLIVMQ